MGESDNYFIDRMLEMKVKRIGTTAETRARELARGRI